MGRCWLGKYEVPLDITLISCLVDSGLVIRLKRTIVPRKGLQPPCVICNEDRISEKAHFPKRKRAGEGGVDTIYLCPTHHRLLDSGRLSKEDFERIMKAVEWESSKQFPSVEEFMVWAHENGYPYGIDDVKKKFWDHSDESSMI